MENTTHHTATLARLARFTIGKAPWMIGGWLLFPFLQSLRKWLPHFLK